MSVGIRPKTEAPREGPWKIVIMGNEREELDGAWAVNVEVREIFTTGVQEKVTFLHDAGFVKDEHCGKEEPNPSN